MQLRQYGGHVHWAARARWKREAPRMDRSEHGCGGEAGDGSVGGYDSGGTGVLAQVGGVSNRPALLLAYPDPQSSIRLPRVFVALESNAATTTRP